MSVEAPRPPLDLLIRNALVYDGSGRTPFHGDVAVVGDRIHAVGRFPDATARRVLDADGLAVSPGFIDAHSHADMTLVRPGHPAVLEPLVRQGITTFVGGNCGTSLAPVSDRFRQELMTFWDFFLGAPQDQEIRWTGFGAMLDTIESQGLLLNAGVLAPHGILRIGVTGGRNDVATPDEVATLKRNLAECLEAGALGLSTGLQYFPGLATDTAELIELARVVHDHGGVFTSHLRSYNSDTLDRALDEVFAIGREAEVPVQVSHLFCLPNHGARVDALTRRALRAGAALYKWRPSRVPLDLVLRPFLDRIARGVASGARIGFDAMPTAAGFTHLVAFFPPWAIALGLVELRTRLADRAFRREVLRSIRNGDAKWPHRGRDSWSMNMFRIMGWESVYIMSVRSDRNRAVEGRSLADLAQERRVHPFDVACDLLIQEQGRVLVFETPTNPGDEFLELAQEGAVVHPDSSIVTDTILLGFGMPSHLFYDCYPRFLGRYARDRGLLPMAEAIRKCTSLPAEQLGIRDRGRIRAGGHADLVVFDPGTIATRSTAVAPARFPTGIHSVFVNGRAVVDPEGFHPEPRAGRLIRH